MFRVLVADDNPEDRDLLKMEILRSLDIPESEIKFFESQSVNHARETLKKNPVDLLTLDIQFDRLTEGLDSLPFFFENYPTLNILVISGKLNKTEVIEQLFHFTKDNVLKIKRWVRQFDVLDKKDEKKEAIQRAYSFAYKRGDDSDKIRDLFLLAESYLEKHEIDKCRDIYLQIQKMVPGEVESTENIDIMRGPISPEAVLIYMRKGDKIVASLLLGHFLETRLKYFTRKRLGRLFPVLHECLKELEYSKKISPYKKELFNKLIRLRNKAIHHPSSITDDDFDTSLQHLKLLEAQY